MRNRLRPQFESRAWVPLERSALEAEIERLHTVSFAWALACCGWRRDEAEDVLQGTYFKILDGRARYEGYSAVKTWLFGVIRKTAADRRRGRLLEVLGLRRWLLRREAVPAEIGADELLAQEERRANILGALGRLAARQREVLDLVFYHGMTVEEAAGVMGVSIGTARVHYDRGKRRLIKQLQSENRR